MIQIEMQSVKKNKEKYSMLTPEQKKKDRQEYKKRWYESLSPERKQEIKQKRASIVKIGMIMVWYL